MSVKLLPASQAVQNARTYFIPSYREFPNSSLHKLPLIVYRPFTDDSVKDGKLSASAVEDLLNKNDLNPAWRYGMFPYNHYHSNTHEVLVPFQGTAELAFGHHESLDVVRHSASAGEVYILPAGMTHRSLSQSNDFQMVGSYPVGSHDWDNCKGGSSDDAVKDELWASVKKMGEKENRLKLDPVYGKDKDSPLSTFWKG